MDNELYHYGVLGMKWGKRKNNSKHQPSSVRSSILAGTYAATGNKTIGKLLDKSNEKDARKWKARSNSGPGKDDYNITSDIKRFTKGSGKAVMAGVTIGSLKTMVNIHNQEKLVKEITDGMFHMSMKDAAKMSAVNIGMGVVGGLLGYKAYSKSKEKINNRSNKR